MKRSEVNAIIQDAEALIADSGFILPPFSKWSRKDWKTRHQETDLVRRVGLGWDITDFGKGNFTREGLVLFTLRNGLPPGSSEVSLPYAEKLLIARENQITLTHYHKVKTEDLIVRGGNPLALRLNLLNEHGEIDRSTPVELRMDSVLRKFSAGETVIVEPGASVTLVPGCAHSFWGHGGTCLIGEVSTINDDKVDNFFFEATARFPRLEEDEEPYRLLVPDYLP